MKLDLEKTKILIIEDFSTARRALKEMLFSLSAWDIHETADAVDALNLLRKSKFDIIICDYNLGQGKSGHQILEEAKHHKLLSLKAVFIMVTAEQSQDMVLGAVESRPDDYLTKPYTAQQLTRRLQRCFEQKQYFYDIEVAIQKYQYAKAIDLCNQVLDTAPKIIQTLLLKCKSELCMVINDFQTAEKIYQDTLEQRELPWALMGLGKIHFLQGDYTKGAAFFQKVISHNPMILEAYDWIAKIHEQKGDKESAKNTLLTATDLSTLSIKRLRKLADWANLTGDRATVQSTYETLIKRSKHSMHRASIDYYKLAKSQFTDNSTDKTLATLEKMRREYVNNPATELSALTLFCAIHKQNGSKTQEQLDYKKLSQLCDQISINLDKELSLDVIKTLHQHNESEKALKLLDKLIHHHVDDEQLLDDITNMHNEIGFEGVEDIIGRIKGELVNINNDGINLFKQGNIKQAISHLEDAEQSMPGNKTLMINLIKIMVKDLQTSTDTRSNNKISRIQSHIDKAQKLGVAEEKLNLIRMELSSFQYQTELS